MKNKMKNKMNNGIKTEYLIYQVLKSCGLKSSSNNFKNIYCKIKKSLVEKIKHIVKKSNILKNIETFEISSSESYNNDICTTADVILYSRSLEKNRISIKHNNCSIKHHRPGNLCFQMGINNAKKRDEYRNRFAKINEKWYKRWQRYDFFSEIPSNEKFRWYREINELTLQFYQTATKRNKQSYIDFILDEKTRYIFNVNLSKEMITVYKKQFSLKSLICESDFVLRQNSLVFVYRGMDIFKMRLHSSKSRVTSILGIKYDVKVFYNCGLFVNI